MAGMGRVGWAGLERAHLAQVKVCVAEEVWMVLPHQANHVVIQLVLFEHGDGEIRLLHRHVQPADRKGVLRLLLHILEATPSPETHLSASRYLPCFSISWACVM
jgi:hypothetical protein